VEDDHGRSGGRGRRVVAAEEEEVLGMLIFHCS
jgi:hypothetical protein